MNKNQIDESLVAPILTGNDDGLNSYMLKLWANIIDEIVGIKYIDVSAVDKLAFFHSICHKLQCEIKALECEQEQAFKCQQAESPAINVADHNHGAAFDVPTSSAQNDDFVVSFTAEQIERLQFIAGMLKG